MGKEEKEEKEEKKDKKDEESTWSKFYKEFAKNLKMGCYEDDSNRSKISKLLRFQTSKADKDISLDKYLDRMAESQESIYYMAGESMDVMSKSPNLQIFKKKDLEVLMLTDHLDESCIQKLADYEGKKFVSIQKADVKVDETDDEKKRFSKLKDMYKPLTDWWKDKLSDLTEKGALKDGCEDRVRHHLEASHGVATDSGNASGEDYESTGLPEQGSDPDDVGQEDSGDQS